LFENIFILVIFLGLFEKKSGFVWKIDEDMMKMREGRRWRNGEKNIGDGAPLDMVDRQNRMVSFFLKWSYG
jgi:hypothetical protein